MAKISTTWSDGGLPGNVANFDQKVKRVITAEFLYAQPESTTYMKENAPWTDRTGNARAGLHSSVNFGEDYWELILAGGVYYQLFLEVCNSGRYAIIIPTMQHFGKLLEQRLAGAIGRIDNV